MPVLKNNKKYQHNSFHACMGSLQNARKKEKNRCGREKVSFCFVSRLYVSEFNSISVSSAGLVGGWGRKNEFDTAGVDRFKYDYVFLCIFAKPV